MDNWLDMSNSSEQTLSTTKDYTEIGQVYATEMSSIEKHRSTSSSKTHNEKSSITYMSDDECMEIWNILKSWKLECVYQTCIGKNCRGR